MTKGIEHEESPGDEELPPDAVPTADAAVGRPAIDEGSAAAPEESPGDGGPETIGAQSEVEEPTHEQVGAPEAETEPVAGSEAVTEPEEGPETVAEPVSEAEAAPEPAPEGEPGSGTEAEPETDDLEAAIAEAGANLEADSTFDDISPGTVATSGGEQPEAEAHERGHDSVPTWPFVVYDAVWLAFAGVLIWQFEQLPAGQAVFESPLYEAAVLGGVALTIAGPVLILATWIGSWGRPGASKGGLFVSALIKGAIATVLGVTLWWVALMALDQLRLGRLL